MGFKSKLAKPIAKRISAGIDQWSKQAISHQEKILKKHLRKAERTAFGKYHHFDKISSYADFKEAVPIRDYEGHRSYVERIKQGERHVLWPGVPKYFAKTSGTTSGVKYIPLTKESIPNHFGTARNALFHYYAKTGKGNWMDGKMIFLSGSPEMGDTNGILTGRLSGIVNHQVPGWLRKNQLPSYSTNCIDDWENKLNKIVEETIDQDMRLISGIPPWVQMYYERLLEKSGKSSIKNLFPNYDVFVYGGVNFEPYRASLESLIGGKMDSIETYPASEGFIAFQNEQDDAGLLLNTNSGIFFEFVKADEIFEAYPARITLKDVVKGVNYAILLSTNAGLWAYNIGDTVEFTSLDPFKIKVTGRTKHFISAFGEHVIAKEIENAMQEAAKKHGVQVTEFSVAPQVNPEAGLPYHEWLIEFEKVPEDMDKFAASIDESLISQNIYYQDLIEGKILRPLVISRVKKGGFIAMMKAKGKLGGQNKVPRVSNDRKLVEELAKYTF